MSSLLVSPWLYLIPALYLCRMAFPPVLPTWASALIAVLGGTLNLLIAGTSAWFAIGFAGVIFVVLVLLGLFSRTTTVGVSVALTCLPLVGWVAFLPGLVVASVVSAVRLRRAAGQGYLTLVAAETYEAVGVLGTVTGTGTITKPNLNRLTRPDTQTTSDGPVGRAHRVKLRFLAYLGTSVALFGVLAGLAQ